MDFCKYKDIFGSPSTGVHSYRLGNLAIVDIIMTLIAAYLIAIMFNFKFIYTLLVLFILGIFLHRVFCVRTTIDKLLFSN
jgi:hypothetical protein